MKSNIRIVLVEPSHPGNIGAVARAMKTMELENLYLVKPKYFPHVDATARAAGADDILANAIITPSLSEALENTEIIFGTSVRFRNLSLPKLNPREAAEIISKKATTQKIAIIFGRENNGLANEELEQCNYHIYIPSNPNFSSLNLAASVQLIAYEIKMTRDSINLNNAPTKEILFNTPELASSKEVQLFYQHLQEVLVAIKFLDLKNPKKVFSRLKILFNRVQLQKNEINILRGIFASILSKLNGGK
jgi:tRNA (cytidine32/uridine32-2'-O)-methyltransferase